ncbi:MAG: hypothetical protein WCV83_00320 [Candidatus Magasanikbacteria bacterium]|jgi:hypothetical protein
MNRLREKLSLLLALTFKNDVTAKELDDGFTEVSDAFDADVNEAFPPEDTSGDGTAATAEVAETVAEAPAPAPEPDPAPEADDKGVEP